MRTLKVRMPDPEQRKNGPKAKIPRSRPRNPASAESDREPDSEISHEDNEASNESRRTVTNTDEQNKVTNAQGSDGALDEKETEGV